MRNPGNIWLNQEGLAAWLAANREHLDAVVLDIDGVLAMGKTPRAGARELLAWLRAETLPFFLLTNDANNSPEEKAKRLRIAGVSVQPGEIVSAGHGVAGFVEKNGLAKTLFFAMGRLGTPCYGEGAGLRITRDPGKLPVCTGILVGEGGYDWESVINACINALVSRPGMLLLSPNPDEYYPTGQDGIHVAAGGVARFVARVAAARGASVDIHYMGKPHHPVFEMCQARIDDELGRRADKDRVLMVGDMLDADILGANRFGWMSALMLGAGTPDSALELSEIRPDLIFASL
ncbi:MAG: HAD-IIA family hydrolase [Desulfatibacillaceae bacterium]